MRRLGLLACALLVYLALVAPTPAMREQVLYADFGVSATVMLVGSILSSFFGLFRGRVPSNISHALDGIRRGVVDLGKEIVNVAARAFGAVAAALGAVKRFLVRFARELMAFLRDWWTRFVRYLQWITAPLINFLKQLRDHIRRIYQRFVRPVLDFIAIVQRVLQLLSLFNVTWARDLDRKLQELVNNINAPFLWVEQKLTWLENWIQRIVTVDGLIQRVALIGATWRDVKILARQWWSNFHRPLTPEQIGNYQRPWNGANVPAATEHAELYIVRREGPDRARIDEHVADARLRLSRLGVL